MSAPTFKPGDRVRLSSLHAWRWRQHHGKVGTVERVWRCGSVDVHIDGEPWERWFDAEEVTHLDTDEAAA